MSKFSENCNFDKVKCKRYENIQKNIYKNYNVKQILKDIQKLWFWKNEWMNILYKNEYVKRIQNIQKKIIYRNCIVIRISKPSEKL